MECYYCKGELKQGYVPYFIKRKDYHLVIDKVPAYVCEQCGEYLFGEKEVDAWEIANGLNPFDPNDALLDSDGDGIPNIDEYKNGTNPNVIDTPVVTTFNVPGAYGTIQAAIDAAHAAGGGVVLVSEGIYAENITIKDGVCVKAQGDPAKTIIDGSEKHNVVVINGNTNPCGIIGFTIQKSQTNGNAFGGIVCNGNNDPMIANCIIKDNNHGIVINGNGKPRIVNNVITGNTGSGIEVNGNSPAEIFNNIIVDNDGEGIACNGKPSLEISYNNIWNNGSSKKDQRVKPDDTGKPDDTEKDTGKPDDKYTGKSDDKDTGKPDTDKDNGKPDTDKDNGKPDTGKADCAEGTDNISSDPMFASAEDYHLSAGSPCIDTGKPDVQDKDGSRSDMGVYGGKWESECKSDTPGGDGDDNDKPDDDDNDNDDNDKPDDDDNDDNDKPDDDDNDNDNDDNDKPDDDDNDNDDNDKPDDDNEKISVSIDGHADVEIYDAEGESVGKVEYGDNPKIDVPVKSNDKYSLVVRGHANGIVKMTVTGVTEPVEVQAKKGGIFKTAVTVDSSGSTFTVGSPEPMQEFDINADGSLDKEDAEIAVKAWENCKKNNTCSEFYDFDGNSKIEFQDMLKIINEINKKGGKVPYLTYQMR